jgi:hypothetical protein
MGFLYRPVSIASLAFFRIGFGILAVAETLALFLYFHLHQDDFNPDKFQFRYFGFEWVQPLPEPWMSGIFILMLLAGFGILFGKWYRLSASFYALAFTYSFLLEKAHYLNHGYFFIWLTWLMALLPAHRAFSADVARQPSIRLRTIPFWSVAILPFLMGVVYFYGGIAKVNADWLEAIPLRDWLPLKTDSFLIGPLLKYEISAYIMAYGGLLLDLGVPFLLLFRKTRPFAFAFVLFFHLTNTLIFEIGIFPWLSILLTSLFFPFDFPLKLIDKGAKRWKWLDRLRTRWEQRIAGHPTADSTWHSLPRFRPAINAALIIIVLFHTLYPFRHHLLEGDVAWTEEGHRFSWRMMLRSKAGHGTFTIIDPATGEKERVHPQQHLSRKQTRKLFTHPDMILQFAHYLRDQKLAEGIEEVEIYADIQTRLNGGPYEQYIDPAVDLAKEEWSQLHESTWILSPGKKEE